MSFTKKTALVMGASGLVGNELVKVLIQKHQYEKIHLMVRRPIQITDSVCEYHLVDFDHLEDFSEWFHVTDVYCCLGTTIKKAKSQEAFRKVDYTYPLEAGKLAAKAGVENFLLISAMGANAKSKIFYNHVKGEIEESLTKMGLNSLHIFRPSLLLGEREEFRLGERIASKASGFLNTIMIGPLRSYKAISAKNVAIAMAEVAASGKKGVHIYPSHEIEQWASGKLDRKI